MDKHSDGNDDNDGDKVCVLNVEALSTLILTAALRTGRSQRCKCFRATKLTS